MSSPRNFFLEIAKILREILGGVRGRLSGRISQSRGHLTSSMTLGFGYVAQLVFQMAYFLILTRMLGPEHFGRFVAALAAINLVSPIAGLGFGEVALLRVSQDPKSAGRWATNAILVTGVMGIAVALGLAGLAYLFTSDQWLDWHLMLGLAISELVLVRCCLVLSRVHLARGEVTRTAGINVSVAAVKAMVALTLLLSGCRSLAVLVILLDICFTPLLFAIVTSLARTVSRSPLDWLSVRQNTRLAFSYATSMFCKTIYTDLDKLFLARWTTSYVVGTYAAGYKMLTLSFMPIRAILEATVSRQLRLAVDDQEGCLRFTTTLLFLNVGIASVIAAFVYLLAPWATYVLGEDFKDSVGVLRIGFLLPVIQAAHCTLGNYLTAMERQTVRTVIQITVLALYIVAGLIVIPLYSWRGAIWTSLVCEALLAVLFGLGCAVLVLKNK